MIKCSECGYENMDGLDYCDGCGAKLNTVAEGATAAASASTPAAASATVAAAAPAGGDAAPAEAKPAEAATSNAGWEAPAQGAPDAKSSEAPTGEIKVPEASAAAPPAAAAAALTFKAKLSVIRGGRRGQEFELEAGNNLVGRWDPETGAFPEVDLDADDPEAKISRKHALIRLDGVKITIEDIGSLNGTYVNRQPRLQPGNPVELKDGDEIIIGKTFLKLAVAPVS